MSPNGLLQGENVPKHGRLGHHPGPTTLPHTP